MEARIGDFAALDSVTVEVPPLLMTAGLKALVMPICPTPSSAPLEGAPATTVSLVVTPDAVLV